MLVGYCLYNKIDLYGFVHTHRDHLFMEVTI
nr:MAG TPA: hypothetical protein [Caudoviricetes sp.]